jgi:hypothetical protein
VVAREYSVQTCSGWLILASTTVMFRRTVKNPIGYVVKAFCTSVTTSRQRRRSGWPFLVRNEGLAAGLPDAAGKPPAGLTQAAASRAVVPKTVRTKPAGNRT